MGKFDGILLCSDLDDTLLDSEKIVSQKNINPTVASLIMSCESIFSAIFGFIILEQVLSNREIIGALIMILGILLAQLPEKWFKFKKRNCK